MCERVAKFTIEGDPVAKGRPKVKIIRKGKSVIPQIYTPTATQEYEKKVAEAYRESGNPLFEGALEMDVLFVFEVPKSWSKKKKEEAIGSGAKLTKPDTDNLIKSLCDGLNGVAFADDSAIYKITAEKIYGAMGRTIVCLKRNM